MCNLFYGDGAICSAISSSGRMRHRSILGNRSHYISFDSKVCSALALHSTGNQYTNHCYFILHLDYSGISQMVTIQRKTEPGRENSQEDCLLRVESFSGTFKNTRIVLYIRVFNCFCGNHVDIMLRKIKFEVLN